MKRLLAVTALLAAGFAAIAADPYAGYIYPAGIQAGTTNRFVIGGQNMWSLQGVHFGNPGLRVLKVEKVPGFPMPATGPQRTHLKNWLDGIAAGRPEEPPKPADPHMDEWRSNIWWRALNTLDAGQLAIVERDLFTPRNSLQDNPSLRQMVLVTVAAETNAEPGWCSFSIWGRNGISAPRPFEVSVLPRVAEPLYVPPHRPQPGPHRVDLRAGGAVLDGQVLPGATDSFLLKLAAGRRYAFKVTARELQPYIGDAVPGFFNAVISLKDDRGKVVASADDDTRFRPDPVLVFTPASEGEYLLEIHDVLYRGRTDFVYAVAVDADDGRLPRPCPAGSPYPEDVAGAAAPDGVVGRPGAVAVKKFTIEEPGPHVLEVTARRRGSPLDAVLTLRKEPGGIALAQWDDVTNTVFTGTIPQGECDPVGVYDFREPGDYIAEVTDRTGHGGEAYVWWLDVRRSEPDFEVRSLRSTLPLRGGAAQKVGFVVVRKGGFAGDVAIEFPENIRPRSAVVVTSGVDTVTAELFFKGKRREAIHPVNLFAHATIDGRLVRRQVVPCDEYEQAFAWRHLVPARSFLLSGIPEASGGKGKRQNDKKGKGKARKAEKTSKAARVN